MYNIDSLLSKFNAAFSVPVHHYRNDILLNTYMEHDFFVDIAKSYMEPYIGKEYPICFVVSPEYVLSGYISLSEKDEYLILGPSFPYEITYRQAEKILCELGLPTAHSNNLLRFFHFVPQMSTVNFQNMLTFLYEILFPEKHDEPIHLTYQVKHVDFFDKNDITINEDINSNVEDCLMPLVVAGLVTEAEQALNSAFGSSGVFLPDLAPTGIRSLKNTIISSTTLVSRKAIEGGLDYRTAMSLSDYYIAKVENLTVLSELQELLRTMILDFTKRVSILTKPDTPSPVINAIYRDVQEHKYEKLTSQIIARRLSFSSSYISHHFKNVTGLTLTQYIHQQKIKEAQYLLDTTNLSLSEISEKLAFSSQQQFQLIFKQVAGITPKQYQNRILSQ